MAEDQEFIRLTSLDFAELLSVVDIPLELIVELYMLLNHDSCAVIFKIVWAGSCRRIYTNLIVHIFPH